MILGNLIPMDPAFWRLAVKAGKNKAEWFREITDAADSHFRIEVNWDNIDPDVRTIVKIDEYIKGQLEAPTLYYTESLVRLATGPKLFFASAEQCEGMEHVDITLPVTDYRQSYPVLGIVFPKEYIQSLKEKHPQDTDIPSVVVLRHYQHLNSLFTCASNPQMEIWHYTFDTRRKDDTIESVIRCHDNRFGQHFSETHEKMNRVAINLALLLSNSPLRVVPDNPQALEKARKRLQKRQIEANEIDVTTHVHRILTQQFITVRKREGFKAGGEGTHASPSAHWRRGHWRRQPFGPGSKERKLVFIQPVFVSGSAAEEGDTTVIYRS